MSEPKEHYGDLSLAEVISRLAHEIRESRKVSAAQLEWFQQQGSLEETINKRLNELVVRLEGKIDTSEKNIIKAVVPKDKPQFSFSVGLPQKK